MLDRNTWKKKKKLKKLKTSVKNLVLVYISILKASTKISNPLRNSTSQWELNLASLAFQRHNQMLKIYTKTRFRAYCNIIKNHKGRETSIRVEGICFIVYQGSRKKKLSHFSWLPLQKGRNVSSITWTLQIQNTTEKIELIEWVLSVKKCCNLRT